LFDFNQNPTLGIDFARVNYTLKDGTQQKLTFWDTAGQERFRNLTQAYYKKADGIILVYDITNK
jgi:small GTP-binding protein